MPGISNSQFNRVAQGLMGATANFALMCSLEQTSPKYLNSIFITVADGGGPYVIANYQIRVMVFSQKGKFPSLATVLDFTPSNVSGTDNFGDVGTIYYDHVITLPYNNPIAFDESIYFSESERIYVACSVPYANGDSIVTPPNRFVRMSINGRVVGAPTAKYLYR